MPVLKKSRIGVLIHFKNYFVYSTLYHFLFIYISRIIQLPSFSQIEPLLSLARSSLGNNLTAFEFMDRNAIDAVRRSDPHLLSK